MAPEIFAILDKKTYSYSVDYWAFGILLFEMSYSMRPFRGHTEQEVSDAVLEEPVIFPRQTVSSTPISDNLKLLIKNLLEKVEDDRLQNLDQLRESPFFSRISFDQIMNQSFPAPTIPDISNPSLNFNQYYKDFECELPIVPKDEINQNLDLHVRQTHFEYYVRTGNDLARPEVTFLFSFPNLTKY